MKHYPIFLQIENLPVVVVGGGSVALRKVRTLLRSGASVTVVAITFLPAFRRFSRIRLIEREYQKSDLKDASLVFAATNIPSLNLQIARHARAIGAWVNVASPPEAGNFIVPSLIQRDQLTLAISTGGASAALAKSLRKDLEERLGQGWVDWIKLLDRRRERIKRAILDPKRRRRLLRELGRKSWVERIVQVGRKQALAELDELISDAQMRGKP